LATVTLPQCPPAPPELRALLDPMTYEGLAPQIVARVVAETQAPGWTAI
jgi:hypothetical protein